MASRGQPHTYILVLGIQASVDAPPTPPLPGFKQRQDWQGDGFCQALACSPANADLLGQGTRTHRSMHARLSALSPFLNRRALVAFQVRAVPGAHFTSQGEPVPGASALLELKGEPGGRLELTLLSLAQNRLPLEGLRCDSSDGFGSQSQTQGHCAGLLRPKWGPRTGRREVPLTQLRGLGPQGDS